MVESLMSPRRLEAAERQRQALELRKTGQTYDAIAQALGYRNPSCAYRAIERALKKTLQQPADSVRQLEIARLDAMLHALWGRALGSKTRPPNPLIVDRILRLMERRARLLGLDAPVKTDVTSDSKPIRFVVVQPPETEAISE